jgi:hypothetical protein
MSEWMSAFDDYAAQAMCHEEDRSLRCLPQSGRPQSSDMLPYLCEPPLKTQIRDQLSRMVVEVLAADALAVCVRIVSPADDAYVGNIGPGGGREASVRRPPLSRSCRGARLNHGSRQCLAILACV